MSWTLSLSISIDSANIGHRSPLVAVAAARNKWRQEEGGWWVAYSVHSLACYSTVAKKNNDIPLRM